MNLKAFQYTILNIVFIQSLYHFWNSFYKCYPLYYLYCKLIIYIMILIFTYVFINSGLLGFNYLFQNVGSILYRSVLGIGKAILNGDIRYCIVLSKF